MAGQREDGVPPAQFRLARDSLRAGSPRPEVALEEVAAPQRLAPYAVAFTADVDASGAGASRVSTGQGFTAGRTEAATGRLVLLHDPAGHDTWDGTLRLVTYVRAELEPDLVGDPLLTGVGWTWLVEALEAAGARYVAASGTVTRIASESFGALAERPPRAEVEIRASWTPTDPELRPHLAAWCELLCTAAGVPPATPRIAVLPESRDSQRG
jgi:hypothetical protein